jgi:hypothetical protein
MVYAGTGIRTEMKEAVVVAHVARWRRQGMHQDVRLLELEVDRSGSVASSGVHLVEPLS